MPSLLREVVSVSSQEGQIWVGSGAGREAGGQDLMGCKYLLKTSLSRIGNYLEAFRLRSNSPQDKSDGGLSTRLGH